MSDRPPRRFGPYPEDAAQDAIYARIEAERDPVEAAIKRLRERAHYALLGQPDEWNSLDGEAVLTVVSALREARRDSERLEVECSCDDWLPAITKINAPIMTAYARNPHLVGTHEFAFLPFRYCPWCGSRVRQSAFAARVPETEDRQP